MWLVISHWKRGLLFPEVTLRTIFDSFNIPNKAIKLAWWLRGGNECRRSKPEEELTSVNLIQKSKKASPAVER